MDIEVQGAGLQQEHVGVFKWRTKGDISMLERLRRVGRVCDLCAVYSVTLPVIMSACVSGLHIMPGHNEQEVNSLMEPDFLP